MHLNPRKGFARSFISHFGRLKSWTTRGPGLQTWSSRSDESTSRNTGTRRTCPDGKFPAEEVSSNLQLKKIMEKGHASTSADHSHLSQFMSEQGGEAWNSCNIRSSSHLRLRCRAWHRPKVLQFGVLALEAAQATPPTHTFGDPSMRRRPAVSRSLFSTGLRRSW